MKKLIVLISTGIICMGLTACDATQFDASAIQDVSRSVEEVSSSVEEISDYVGEIQESVQAGIDETNAVMEWYKTEAWANNPWISTPVTEEEVEGLIDAGQKEINSYIGDNAVYDVLGEDDIEFFNEYFNDESVNGFLLSTYEKPEVCDAVQVFSRYSAAIEDLSDADKDKKGDEYAGKVSAKVVEDSLEGTLGISNRELVSPLKLSTSGDDKYLFIENTEDTVKLVCDGGFYYNNIFVIMMREEGKDTPFALTVLEKNDDSVKITMNYWSDDMEDVQWDGSFLYDLYDMMQDSDIRNVISIPGLDGNALSLGEGLDLDTITGGRKIEDTMELVSGAKDKAKTYMQEFDGYEVYYSNMDPKAAGEYVISQIDVTSGDFKTAEGAGIGTTVDQLKEIYGEGIETRFSGGREQIAYERGKYSMLFLINKAGEVEEMTMFLNDAE